MNNFKPFPEYAEVGFYCDEFRTFYNRNKPQPNFKYVFLLDDNLNFNILKTLPRQNLYQKLNNHKVPTFHDQLAIILNKKWWSR